MGYPVWDSGSGFCIVFDEKRKAINTDYDKQQINSCHDGGLDIKVSYPSLVDSLGDEKWNYVAFPYGMFSLSAASSDFERVQRLMGAAEKDSERNAAASRLRFLLQNGTEAGDGLYRKIAHPIAKIVVSSLRGLYLDIRQRAACYYMLRDEIADRIMADPSLLDSPRKCLPEIYQGREIQRHIQSVLLKEPDAFDSPLQEWINMNIIPCSHLVISGGCTMTFYYPFSLMDFLKLDISRYLQSCRSVKRCECCGHLFIPSRASEKYCRLPHKDTHLQCKDIAHRGRGSEFDKAKSKARGYQRNSALNESMLNHYDRGFLQGLYDEWSAECTKKCMEYKWHNDIDGFKQWIEETKLTAEAIAERYAQQQGSAASE